VPPRDVIWRVSAACAATAKPTFLIFTYEGLPMMKRILALGGIGLSLTLMHLPGHGAEWTQPMTSWGEPDIQGMWPINHLIGVPLQRNERYGDRLYMSDEEFAAAQSSVEARDERFQGGPIPVADAAGMAIRQTSLIVDPPNGRFPELTDYGKNLQSMMRSSYDRTQTLFDYVGDFSAWDRCITRGMPVSMMPRNYNNGIRIFQSP